MPKIDLQYSHGALHADVLGPLTDRITGILLERKGLPDTPERRANVWWFTDEQRVFVAGAAPGPPLAMITFTLLGALDADATEGLVAEATMAVKAVAPETRVWIVVNAVQEGDWAVEGEVVRSGPAADAA